MHLLPPRDTVGLAALLPVRTPYTRPWRVAGALLGPPQVVEAGLCLQPLLPRAQISLPAVEVPWCARGLTTPGQKYLDQDHS